MDRFNLHTKRNCKYCLGTGVSTPIIAGGGNTVCSCILEQITIRFVEADYTINDRYEPGTVEYKHRDSV